MFVWICENIATIVVGAILITIVAIALKSVISKLKSGGCNGCSGCSHSDKCHH